MILAPPQFSVLTFEMPDGVEYRYGLLKRVGESCPSNPRVLVFIPGLGGTVKTALPFLTDLLTEYDVIYGLDLPGFGLNLATEVPLERVEPLFEYVLSFLETISPQWPTGFTLCGISLGASLATVLGTEKPDGIQEILLLSPAFSPHPKTFSPMYRYQNMLGQILWQKHYQAKLPYTLDSITRNRRILGDPQYRNQPSPVLTPQFLVSTQALCTKAFKNTAFLTVPTMMVIPESDLICDPKTMAKGFRRIPHQTPKNGLLLPGFYHNLLMEEEYLIISNAFLHWKGWLKKGLH